MGKNEHFPLDILLTYHCCISLHLNISGFLYFSGTLFCLFFHLTWILTSHFSASLNVLPIIACHSFKMQTIYLPLRQIGKPNGYLHFNYCNDHFQFLLSKITKLTVLKLYVTLMWLAKTSGSHFFLFKNEKKNKQHIPQNLCLKYTVFEV